MNKLSTNARKAVSQGVNVVSVDYLLSSARDGRDLDRRTLILDGALALPAGEVTATVSTS